MTRSSDGMGASELLRELAFVWRLAQRLVRPADAEDHEQDVLRLARERRPDGAPRVRPWLAVVALFAFAACRSSDPSADPVSIRVELPKKFTREAIVRAVVTNDGSAPVFVATLDGTRIKLLSEFRRENGFTPWGGNRPFTRDGVVLAQLGPGETLEGRIRVDELPPITRTAEPSALDIGGNLDSVEGEFRLAIELHTRGHAATERPPDCRERRLVSPSFVVPLTEWTR